MALSTRSSSYTSLSVNSTGTLLRRRCLARRQAHHAPEASVHVSPQSRAFLSLLHRKSKKKRARRAKKPASCTSAGGVPYPSTDAPSSSLSDGVKTRKPNLKNRCVVFLEKHFFWFIYPSTAVGRPCTIMKYAFGQALIVRP
jgi:hypothetical protein